MRFADVAIAARVHTAFTYSIPDGMLVEPGMRVTVPFHRRRATGICLELRDRPPAGMGAEKMRAIIEAPDAAPSISAPLMRLVRWISSYYCAPIGEVCRAALPARLMQENSPRTTRPTEPVEFMPLHQPGVKLTEEQESALAAISSSVDGGRAKVFLVEGITGSGKTEVYLRLFEKLAAEGRRGLLLVPEIGLTPQLTGRASARFGGRVAVYHSGLTDAQRHAQWLKMKSGDAVVAIGTRSALFAPLPDLGAIVVDEEHDGSYKQDDGVSYNGRDGAVMRAHMEGITAVLGSATPSLESLENVRRGKYAHCRLISRPTGAPLPSVEIVDLRARNARREKTEGESKRRELGALSPALYDAIAEALARREQVLLFTGRRGFAGSLQCDACGEAVTCPNCDIALTLHRGSARSSKRVKGGDAAERFVLSCHYCDYSIPEPKACPSCGEGQLLPLGHGTERLEDELADFFPKARVARLDSDSAGGSARRKKILDDVRRGKIDILVGTQMITKGHDFPGVTLVGVVSADTSLHLPDFRAAERTFQLLTQVAGRAGRGERAGRVIIQTRQPGHASFAAAKEHDVAAFAEAELCHRRELFYPPCARLANVKLSSTSSEKVEKAAASVARIARSLAHASGKEGGIVLLGPAAAPFSKLRGRHRWQLLIKAPSSGALTGFISRLRPALSEAVQSGIRLSIDVDPSSLL